MELLFSQATFPWEFETAEFKILYLIKFVKCDYSEHY